MEPLITLEKVEIFSLIAKNGREKQEAKIEIHFDE